MGTGSNTVDFGSIFVKALIALWHAILGGIKTFRLALPKLGVGWMFALLTVNFNRITVVELGVTAVAVSAMLAMHYFLSPFQVISGRIADRNPIFGLRRTPYLLIAATLGSLVFLALPSVAQAMGAGNPLAYVAGFGLLMVFGVMIAVMGDTHHSLIAEVTTTKGRGGVISVVWTFTILSTIIAAGVMKSIMPDYTPERMQYLYGLTPWVVIISAFLGVIGMEKRLTGQALTDAIEQAKRVAPPGNPLQAAVAVLRQNKQAAAMFVFIFVAIFSIFLQDNILEVFGAEVFGMSVGETSGFQQSWGGGVLLGMLLMGVLSAAFAIKKRTIALIGTIGTAAGMLTLATAALFEIEALVTPALTFMGFFTGFFNVGALSMMMDMTVPGATGLFMGLWGMAQAFGNGLASFSGGALHTAFIESQLMVPQAAYFTIFSIEAVGMIVASVLVWRLSVDRFHTLHNATLKRDDMQRAMEVSASD